MSASDPLKDGLTAAAEFLSTVRKLQQESGRSLRGRAQLTPEQSYAITQGAENSGLVNGVKESLDIDIPIHTLFERFEEMCRRQNVMVDANLRPYAIKLLSTELVANQNALGGDPEKLIPFTLGNGALGAELISDAEFESLRETPGVFRQAAVDYPGPGKAKEFLRGVMKNVPELAADAEFESLRDTPGVFQRAAVGYPGPGKAKEFLRGVMKTVPELAADAEFESLRDTPGVFQRAAVSYPGPGKAKEFLRGVMKTVPELAADAEFESLRDTPGVFQRAAVSYPGPGKAKEFLRVVNNGRADPEKHAARIELGRTPILEELGRGP